jgi:hypothetical protein
MELCPAIHRPGEVVMTPASTLAADSDRDAPGRLWQPLYLAGAGAALVSAVLLPVQVAVFLIWPPPLDGTAADWFDLLAERRLVGLVDLDLLLVAANVLLIPLLLAFAVLLWRNGPSWIVLAEGAGFIAVTMFIAVNPAIGMAALSDRYAEATTESARAAAVSAGDTLLATWQGSAFHTGYLLGSFAGVVIGAMMLRGGTFSRLAAWCAILGNGVGLGLYMPGIGLYIAVFSVVFLELWYILVARTLLTVAHRPPTPAA